MLGQTDECSPALINLEVAAVAGHDRVIIRRSVQATLAAPGLHRHHVCRGYYFTTTDEWNATAASYVFVKLNSVNYPEVQKNVNVVPFLWCSSADVQPVRSPGANLDPLLSTFSPNQIKPSWNLIPTPFFSPFLEIRLCWFTLVKILRSSFSACIGTNGLGTSSPVRMEEDRFSEGPWHHRASTAEALHYLPSSHPSFCIRWSDLRCWDYRGCDVVIYTETQTHQNMHICRNNHGNQQEETVLPLMFWKVLTLLWQQETG